MTVLGGSVAISRAVLSYPTLTGQTLRYAVAAAVLFLFIARGPWPNRRDLARLAVLAATGLVGFNLCLLTALRHADAAVVGTIVAISPLVLAIAGPLLSGARPAPRLIAASTVVVVGAALVEGTGRADLVGLLAAVGTLAGEVLFSLLAAGLLPRLGPARVSAWTCALAVPMLGLSAVMAREAPRMPTATEGWALAYLALVLTCGAFLLWYAGLQRLGVARAGLFVGVLPVATLVAAALLDRRLPGAGSAIGVLVVATALAFSMITENSPGQDTEEFPRSCDSARRTSSAYSRTARRSAASASRP
jgi:drug/metabolite transporter (DMT)-like permease